MATLPTLPVSLQTLFGTTKITQPQGTSEGGGRVEQGIDLGLSAGTPVRLAEPGSLLWTNGYQSIFSTPSGQVQSYTHITANNQIPAGLPIAAGSIVGWVSNLFTGPGASGPPPATYSSTGPHIEVGVFDTQAQAQQFAGGLDIASFLETAASGSWFRDTSSSATPAIESGNDAILGKTLPPGAPVLGASPQQIGGALAGGATQIAGDAAGSLLGVSLAGKPVRTWVTLAVIIVAALLVFNALLRGDGGQQTVVAA